MSLPVPRDSQEELGYSCLLMSKEGTHHQVRGVGEEPEPREGPSPAQSHTAPCQGPCWASGAWFPTSPLPPARD